MSIQLTYDEKAPIDVQLKSFYNPAVCLIQYFLEANGNTVLLVESPEFILHFSETAITIDWDEVRKRYPGLWHA